MRDAGQGFYVVRPGGVRSRYGPVVYLEPRTPANREQIGKDMFADPQRHATMARARDENAVRMTGPVRLDAGMGRQVSGVVMYAPVYRFGTPATRSARRAALQGWIHAPLDMQAFVDARSEEHTSELQSLMRISYAVFCLKKKKT